MSQKSRITRSPAIAELVRDLIAGGSTLDEITADVNSALAAAGGDIAISRSAVGRFAKKTNQILEAKQRTDAVIAALGKQISKSKDGEDPLAGRIELVRTLVFDSALAAGNDGAIEPAQAKILASAILDIEKAAQLNDKRIDIMRERTMKSVNAVIKDKKLDSKVAKAFRDAVENPSKN